MFICTVLESRSKSKVMGNVLLSTPGKFIYGVFCAYILKYKVIKSCLATSQEHTTIPAYDERYSDLEKSIKIGTAYGCSTVCLTELLACFVLEYCYLQALHARNSLPVLKNGTFFVLPKHTEDYLNFSVNDRYTRVLRGVQA